MNDSSISQKMTIGFSQSMMQVAVEYYLRNKMLKDDVSVNNVETDPPADLKINSVTHFKVHLTVPV